MTFPDILRRSWHNIGRAKVRVGLTAAALMIGAATMTLALAITQGAQDTIQKGFGDFTNTYVLVKGFAMQNNSSTGVQTSEDANKAADEVFSKTMGPKEVDEFKTIDGVSKVIPLNYYDFDEVELSGTRYQAPPVQPYLPVEQIDELIAGKLENLKAGTVIIPERYIKQAGGQPKDFIGKKLTFVRKGTPALFSRPATPDEVVELTVVGVTKSDPDAKAVRSDYAYLAPETMSALAEKSSGVKDPAKRTYASIFLITDESETEAIKTDLTERGYEVETRQDNVGEALESISAVRTALLVFAGVAIFTAIFGVINTQLMSVLERTREIGILKALGLSKSSVLLLFTIEAGWIGFIGSLAGVILAVPFSLLLGMTGNGAPLTLPNILLVVVVLILVSMLSGFLPARRAAKLDPVEALRSE